MTLAAFLEELRDVDLDVFAEIDLVSEVWSGFSITVNPNKIFHHMIQGCIQRACERRGWEGILLWRAGTARAMISEFRGGFGATEKLSEQEAGSPAEALLAAYVAAVRAGQ